MRVGNFCAARNPDLDSKRGIMIIEFTVFAR
jgi:hypothetical protein